MSSLAAVPALLTLWNSSLKCSELTEASSLPSAMRASRKAMKEQPELSAAAT